MSKKCGCTVLLRFDDDFHKCLCGNLYPIEKQIVMPQKVDLRSTYSHEKAMANKTWVTEHLEELKSMRADSVGWKTIIKRLDCKCSESTLAKHYKAVTDDPKKKKKQRFYNQGIKQRYVRNDALLYETGS